MKINSTAAALERSLSSQKHLLLFLYKTQVWLPAPTWWLTDI